VPLRRIVLVCNLYNPLLRDFVRPFLGCGAAIPPLQVPGNPMTLGNMRELEVHRLIASCLNPA
jgi:hypothetical protein